MIRPLLRGLLLCAAVTTAADGQLTTVADTSALSGLTRRAMEVHPSVRAASARLDAVRARVGPAGTRPDPMLMAGIQNFPVAEPGFSDFMTMKMVGVSQTLPARGRLRLRRSAAERGVAAAEARLRMTRLEAAARARSAYFELAYLDRALEIVTRNQSLLQDFARVTESRYGLGTASQSDVLQARVEIARLAEEASGLTEQRRIAQARLNEALDLPNETAAPRASISATIVTAAAPATPRESRFVSPTLGARAADSPLPLLAVLQQIAIENSPALAEHDAMVQAQAVRVELARREHLPDIDVSVQYGQRDGFSDMISATVSVPLPINRANRQRPGVLQAQAELTAEEAGHHEMRNRIGLEVARLHSELEQDRAQLALYVGSILPQARAALQSATSSYQVGRTDLLALLQIQATVFNYETQYHRLLTDFAQKLAELEAVVGKEILR